jgi:helix-turn-helix protein
MNETHDDIVRLLDDGIIEITIRLNLNTSLDVALKNYLLNHHSATQTGVITYERMWEQSHYSLEIHQETLYVMQQLFDLAKAVGDEQNTNKA